MRHAHPRALLITLILLAAPHALAHAGHGHSDEADGGQPYDHPADVNVTAAARIDLANRVTIEEANGFRVISSNGIPDHATGDFPNRGNPNTIAPQDHEFRVPLDPKANDEPTPMRGPFGVALNGVPFDPGTAEFWSPSGRRFGPPRDGTAHWNYDALSGKINLGLDKSNAHVQPTGAYHYHGLPEALLKQKLGGKPQTTMILLGYAGDGFPIYAPLAHNDADDAGSKLRKMTPSYRLKDGQRPGGDDGPGGRYDGTFVQDWEYVDGLGDLDACNGRTGVTPEYPDGTYYYLITDAYPFIPRQFRGTPDRSFSRGPGDGGERPGGPDGRRPPRDGMGPPPGHRPPPPRD